MKGIVLYRSLHGCTRQYAEWIAEETGFNCVDFRRKNKKEIRDADAVIIGAPVLAGRMSVAGWIIANWPMLREKKVILFSSSGAGPDSQELANNFETNFPEEIRKELPYFPMGGRLFLSDLKPIYRFMMNMGIRMQKDPEVKAEMARGKDNMDRGQIMPLVAALA